MNFNVPHYCECSIKKTFREFHIIVIIIIINNYIALFFGITQSAVCDNLEETFASG